jgi:hypothetical protein
MAVTHDDGYNQNIAIARDRHQRSAIELQKMFLNQAPHHV